MGERIEPNNIQPIFDREMIEHYFPNSYSRERAFGFVPDIYRDYEYAPPPGLEDLPGIFCQGRELDWTLISRIDAEVARGFMDWIIAQYKMAYEEDEPVDLGEPHVLTAAVVYKQMRLASFEGDQKKVAAIHATAAGVIPRYPQQPVELGLCLATAFRIRSEIEQLDALEAKDIATGQRITRFALEDRNRAQLLQGIAGKLNSGILEPGQRIVLDNELMDELGIPRKKE